MKVLTVIKLRGEQRSDEDPESIRRRMIAARSVGSNSPLEDYFAVQLNIGSDSLPSFEDDNHCSLASQETRLGKRGKPKNRQYSASDHKNDKVMEELCEKFIAEYGQDEVCFMRIMNFLSDNLVFEKNLDLISSTSEHSFMFDFNFKADSKKFRRIFKYLFRIINKAPKVEKFILQIPYKLLRDSVSSASPKSNDSRGLSMKNYDLPTAYDFQAFYFGSLIRVDKFFSRFEYSIDPEKDQRMSFKHTAKDLFDNEIELFIHFGQVSKILRVVWKIEKIKRLVIHEHSTFDRVFFELDCAPIYYEINGDEHDFRKFIDGHHDRDDRWNRILEFEFLKNGQNQRFDENIVGLSRTICLDFCRSSKEQFSDLQSSKCDSQKTNIFALLLVFIDRIRTKNIGGFHIPVYAGKVQMNYCTLDLKKIERLLADVHHFNFKLHYAQCVLFKNSFKPIDLMLEEGSLWKFLQILAEVSDENNPIKVQQLEQIIFSLAITIENEPMLNAFAEFQRLFSLIDSIYVEPTSEKYDTFRMIEIYPSHTRYLPPINILQSRFSRQAEQEYSLRVKLLDDGGKGYGFGSFEDQNFTTERAKKILIENGIKIGDREFSILAASMNQMKECCATFYAEDQKGHTADNIRKKAGNFENCKTISKLLARLSLIFSQGSCMFLLDKDIPLFNTKDIPGGPKHKCSGKVEHHCMTDGIGYYSTSVGKYFYVQAQVDQVMNGYEPSAYQIRFRGYKGMLAHHPGASHGIYFRPSQQKFNSNDKNFVLLKYAYPRPAKLNLSVIMILADAHRVNPLAFYKCFQQSAHGVTGASLSEQNATVFLTNFGQTILSWKSLNSAGISILDEPFLRSILRYLMAFRLEEDLKRKMRLTLSTNIARCAFGVVDETGTLKPGEVFFQPTKMDDEKNVFVNERKVLTGKVMLFRNPAMQPGDVRTFEAVDVPALRHHKDCIVFPVNGLRTHADELSGGDYDGDEFVIICESDLMINRNEKAMDFPYGQSMKLTKGEVTAEIILEFLLNCFIKQKIGTTAVLHTKVADFHPEGLFSKECLILAKNYNVMLDSSKTGYFKTEKRDISMSHEPDFKVNSSLKKQYLSVKMPGQLFRQCNLLKNMSIITDPNFDPNFKNFSAVQLLKNRFTLEGWHFFRDHALVAFQNYKLRICSLLDQAKLSDEAIIFTDCFDQKEYDISDQMQSLRDFFVNLFLKQSQKLKLDENGELFLMSAWYTICLETPLKFKDKPLLGLPWLVTDKMIQLARYVRSDEKTEFKISQVDGFYQFEIVKRLQNQVIPYDNSQQFNIDPIYYHKESIVFSEWQIKNDHVHNCYISRSFLDSLISPNGQVPNNILQNFQTAITYAIKHIVYVSIVQLFKSIRDDIYFPDQIFFVEYNHEHQKPEEVIIKDIVHKRLTELMNRFSEKNRGFIPTVSTLLNLFFLYLHNLASNVNPFINDLKNRDISDIFLLKYAVLASVFIHKVDSSHDKLFIKKMALVMRENPDQILKLLQEDNSQTKSNEVKNQIFKISEGIYFKVLDDHYNSQLKCNTGLKQTVVGKFALLPRNDFPHSPNLVDTSIQLRFLSGVRFVSLGVSETFYPQLGFHQEQRPMIDAKIIGSPLNVDLLKIIAASPDVFTNVLSRFAIHIGNRTT